MQEWTLREGHRLLQNLIRLPDRCCRFLPPRPFEWCPGRLRSDSPLHPRIPAPMHANRLHSMTSGDPLKKILPSRNKNIYFWTIKSNKLRNARSVMQRVRWKLYYHNSKYLKVNKLSEQEAADWCNVIGRAKKKLTTCATKLRHSWPTPLTLWPEVSRRLAGLDATPSSSEHETEPCWCLVLRFFFPETH